MAVRIAMVLVAACIGNLVCPQSSEFLKVAISDDTELPESPSFFSGSGAFLAGKITEQCVALPSGTDSLVVADIDGDEDLDAIVGVIDADPTDLRATGPRQVWFNHSRGDSIEHYQPFDEAIFTIASLGSARARRLPIVFLNRDLFSDCRLHPTDNCTSRNESSGVLP